MFKLNKLLSLSLGISFLTFNPFVCADETLTITTYYPSPYGSYSQLQSSQLSVGDTNGDGSLTSADLPPANGQIYAARSVIYKPQAGTPSSNQVTGELVYNSSDSSYYYWDGSQWTKLGDSDITCPSGFTNVTAAGRQLGCIETAVHANNATWYTAATTCFTAYGGRLPTYSEWYIAWTRYALTATSTWFEWLDNSDYYSQAGCAMAPWWVPTAPTTNPPGTTNSYRCWIPR